MNQTIESLDISSIIWQQNEFFAQNPTLITLMLFGVLLLILGTLLFFGKTVKSKTRKTKRKKLSSIPNNNIISRNKPWANMADPKNQMDAVAAVGFKVCNLLNKEEFKVLPVLERAIKTAGIGHRVMAQTSLGELIKPINNQTKSVDYKKALASINSKRLDFAVFDKFGRIVCAIEYQGSGHYHKNTFMRDAVKREALRKAGVLLIEVTPDFSASRLEKQILDMITPNSIHTA